MSFSPHITVATIVEDQGRFLFVRETDSRKGPVLNQPAGHLEAGESLTQAAVRETLEETAWHVVPDALVGIYLYQAANGVTYQRVCFAASPAEQLKQALDPDISETLWLTFEQLLARQSECRSPLVLRCLEDFLNGSRHPLSALKGLF